MDKACCSHAVYSRTHTVHALHIHIIDLFYYIVYRQMRCLFLKEQITTFCPDFMFLRGQKRFWFLVQEDTDCFIVNKGFRKCFRDVGNEENICWKLAECLEILQEEKQTLSMTPHDNVLIMFNIYDRASFSTCQPVSRHTQDVRWKLGHYSPKWTAYCIM